MTLSIRDWLALKPETRAALAKIFRLNRSSFTHVVDNHVESDGYTYHDLEGITVEEMKSLTHLESDSFEEQFKMIVQMVEGEVGTTLTDEHLKKGIEEIRKINAEDVPHTSTLLAEKNATNGDSTTSAGKAEDKGTVTTGSGSKAKAPVGKK